MNKLDTTGKILTVKPNYSPREWAREFHEAPQRWKVLVMHRRSGKTTACLNHLMRDACRNKNSRYAYIAPYYRQAKQVAWDMLKEYSAVIPGSIFNEAELRVDYPNGSRIQLFGADNPDALRGIGLWGVIFDEYSQQPATIFTEVIRPALADNGGYAVWIGTPKGRNDFFRLYDQKQGQEEWYVRLLRASESGILPKEELEDAKKTMTLDEFNQEFECSFEAAMKGAYYSPQLSQARKEQRISNVPYSPTRPVYTYWDLGISDYTCILFVQRAGRELHVIDYYENNGCELEHYTIELRKRGYEYAGHYLPHDIKARELGTGRSRYDVLGQQLGRESLHVVPQLSVKDGIDAARKTFDRCWFDKDKTILLIDALAAYTQEWNDRRGMFNDKPLHNWASHAADAFRMLGVSIREEVEIKNHPIRSKYNSQKRFDGIKFPLGHKPIRSKYNSSL